MAPVLRADTSLLAPALVPKSPLRVSPPFPTLSPSSKDTDAQINP